MTSRCWPFLWFVLVFSSLCLCLVLLSETLINNALIFIFFILTIITFLPNWSSYLLLLLYIGGLFALVVYTSSFSFSHFYMSLWLYWSTFLIGISLFQTASFTLVSEGPFWVFVQGESSALCLGFLFSLFCTFTILSLLLSIGNTSRNLED